MGAFWFRKILLAGLFIPLLFGAAAGAAPTPYAVLAIRPFFSPSGINERGQLVGLGFNDQGLGQGMIWTRDGNPARVVLGVTYDTANDINDAGLVAGSHRFGPDAVRAAVFDGAAIRDLGTLGGAESTAFGINASGQVTGYAQTALGLNRAFLHADGAMRDLGSLGGGQSFGYDINDRGEVVGASASGPGADAPMHAFLYAGGSMLDLGTLGWESSFAWAINNAGQVVGNLTGGGESRAFLYQDGVMTDLGHLGGNGAVATAINERGDIVGYGTTAAGESHAFIYRDGQLTDLNTLLDTQEGWTVDSAAAINGAGEIAGFACRPHPVELSGLDCAGVLLIPVPEPAPWMLWTSGLLLGVAWRRAGA
jgi:probable HAF family extracellular repeat protein